ncbi:helicase-related protein [Gluconobacter oxydans]|uniref:ATP-dependent DNA helicase n=1 Tax=Gluconobacter oxydans NBRC 3293 TaxID=1315969 RepID=A0A829X3V7_GLUOY|nr:helicase-related protein [Gluconobacter oxydans]GEM17507.1 ATP-dependent DNA helicase [Gluconobacter oxydans NBRC 3293]
MLAFAPQAPDHSDMKGAFHGTSSGHHTMPASIRAALGPTNTGKTHYALTRMMAHASGIIGFPLRLLARENYERLVKIKGERSVALITGEEKIVPPGARWFSCTVEAMPLDRKAEFVAIDEIQLASDPDRGHIFTDRLLHARGTVETLFLGAETIRPLLQKLVPGIEIDIRTRLSSLSSTGHTKLSRLPPRSAIVAFSMSEVYALAEVIRRRRGGCAVIMGQLSPRTRNAQVELYQNREVDYLVATDAIGMGLNMDVDHVALAQLSKFDGTVPRPLFPQEIAQIAGRAGRGMKDGTFGTTADCPPMSSALVEAVEQHRFDPIQRLYWRNHELDFTNPANLLKSLTRLPPLRGLTAGRVASDVTTLESLMLDPDIRESARGKRATMLLWDVCQIPDFRKLGDDSHTRLCARLYMHLLKEGAVPANWMEGHIRGLAKTEGDIDTLMHRLTGVRVCSYVAARTEWSRHSAMWQERAREVEDLLSDALHERLTARFVDRRATTLLRRLDSDSDRTLLSAVKPDGEVLVEGHSIGRIRGFTLETDVAAGPDRQIILRAGRKALLHEIPRRIRMLQDAPDTSLRLDTTNGELFWEDTRLGRLAAGPSLLRPAIQLFPAEFTDTVQKTHVETRLLDFVAQLIQRDLKPLYRSQALADRVPQLRAILHRLMEDGGITETLPEDHALSPALKSRLRKGGVEVGRFSIYCPALFRTRPLALLGLLHALHNKTPIRPTAPGRVSLPWSDIQGQFGWIRAGDTGLRLDIAERCIAEMHQLAVRHDHAAPLSLASRLGVKADMLPSILKGLGIAHQPAEAPSSAHAGPPRPLMILNDRKTRASRRRRSAPHHAPPRRPAPPRTDSPFAALAALREKIRP